MQVSSEAHPLELVKCFDPHDSHNAPQEQAFIDECVCIVVPVNTCLSNWVGFRDKSVPSVLFEND